MMLRSLTIALGLCASGSALAGGLFLPGNGVVSTSRAGAAVASTEGVEAIVLNPAGMAKTEGTEVTLGIVAIDYIMSFARAGTYDPIMEESVTYANQPYAKIDNDPHPPLGIGPYQPVPTIGVVSDLGGKVPHLHAGFGIGAPAAYPFRDMNNVNGKPYFVKTDTGYDFPTFGDPPPSSRYDIIHEEAAIILFNVAASYSITPQLDVGARYGIGTAQLKSSVAVWGLQNYEEWNKQDGLFTLDAKGTVLNVWGLGATFRPTDDIEIAANYASKIDIHAKGDAYSVNGPAVSLNGAPVMLVPPPDAAALCEKGGTTAALKGCVDVELPMHAEVGGRYKFHDENGKPKGDVELQIGWEHWGAKCDYNKDPTCLNPSDFHVTVDGIVTTPTSPGGGVPLKPNLVQHGLQDSYSVRVAGSWNFPMGENTVVARGGIGYDTAAAKQGWERADLDGAARTMIALGGSYKLPKWSIDAGFSVLLEGTRTNNRNCNPNANPGNAGCLGNGTEAAVDGYDAGGPVRQGPDPINPILAANVQTENPVNQGTFSSHYLMFMIGASRKF